MLFSLRTGALARAALKVEAVEIEAFDQVAAGLGFEGAQRGVAKLLVGRPVAGGDAVEQALIENEQLLFASVHGGRSAKGPRGLEQANGDYLQQRPAQGPIVAHRLAIRHGPWKSCRPE